MSKQSKLTHLAHRKSMLLKEIQQQREDLHQSSQLWLKETEPYDRTWQWLLNLKPVMLVGASVMSVYSIKHSQKLIRWSRRAISLYGLVRTLQKSFNKTSH